ncbi:MAG: NUDIX hydrolase [Candidatus Binatia bacterium]
MVADKYGQPKRVTCRLPSLDFPPVSKRRHGEVCMAIERPNGCFLLQTKRSYPDSVMRLPTGGIHAGEDIESALLREIWEETNLTVTVASFVAAMKYRDQREESPFRTYVFVARETDGVLASNDPSEGISSWVEARPEELPAYASKLRNIIPSWSSWGVFRAAALDVLFAHCTGKDP